MSDERPTPELPDPLAAPYREREKSVTMERVAHGAVALM